LVERQLPGLLDLSRPVAGNASVDVASVTALDLPEQSVARPDVLISATLLATQTVVASAPARPCSPAAIDLTAAAVLHRALTRPPEERAREALRSLAERPAAG
jgi:hypothetical protein